MAMENHDAVLGNEWDQPIESPDVGRRGALVLWVLGGVQVLVMGCLVTGLAVVALVPREELAKESSLTPEQLEMINQQFRPVLVPVAVGVMLLGFLPAVAYLVLGGFVRQGKAVPTLIALLLVLMQIFVLGLLLLGNLYSAVTAHNPASFTMNVLVVGTLMALLIYAARSLLRVREQGFDLQDEQRGSWNNDGGRGNP